jgi:hypothetical protein
MHEAEAYREIEVNLNQPTLSAKAADKSLP